ncbi:tripartite tricarboxylate transporter substrate binding protein [Achromobacter sp. NPDC058515]|uniref:tripartite tricarboxylate transporter substrate binding protein n=1 Tax=Achromobacter sp. NPDC058515 TaxID=3346533 RepID=UPI003650877F
MTDHPRSQASPGRRSLLKLGLALPAALALPRPARAAGFPNRPVTLIVPFPAGGATDTQMRALAIAASRELGQTVIVANRPGAGGTLGPAAMAQTAAPDGYTVSIVVGTLFRYPFLQQVNYDPLRDFTYVACMTAYSYGIVVREDAPWKTLDELIAHARANPEKISYGGTGAGGSGRIAIERLSRLTGAKFNFIPYKGAAEETTALLGGHIQMVSDAGWGPMIDTGKARLLAVMGDARAKRVPDVPTLTELGYPIIASNPVGIAGPKDMDPKVVSVLQKAFHRAARDPDYNRALENADQPHMLMDSAAYTDFAIRQVAEEKKFVAELGLKMQ